LYRFDKPWPHIVIDDYYTEGQMALAVMEIFAVLRNDRSEFITKTADKIFITKSNLYKNSKFPNTKNLLESRDTKNFLEYFADKRNYSNLTLYGEAILCLDASEHPIHDEAENKVISAVTYLYPQEGQGTLIYDQEKNFVKQIEWKPNRMMVFAGKTGLTWHSYKSTGGIRLSLNSFLLND
jgi:hypothetical protein